MISPKRPDYRDVDMSAFRCTSFFMSLFIITGFFYFFIPFIATILMLFYLNLSFGLDRYIKEKKDVRYIKKYKIYNDFLRYKRLPSKLGDL